MNWGCRMFGTLKIEREKVKAPVAVLLWFEREREKVEKSAQKGTFMHISKNYLILFPFPACTQPGTKTE